jgi:hypothetical protein
MSIRDDIARLPTGSPHVRKNDDVCRTHENEPAPAPADDAGPSTADLAHDVDVLAEATNLFTEACDRKFERLERENSYLRGQIDALAQVVGLKLGNTPASKTRNRRRKAERAR